MEGRWIRVRYDKYDGPWADTQRLKDRVRRQCRKAKWLDRGGHILCWTTSLLLLAVSFGVIGWLLPGSEDTVLKILTYIGRSVLALVLAPLSVMLGLVAGAPLWNIREKTRRDHLQEAQYEACGVLRDYYRFREPFLVTKCYHSTDRRFSRHDVCLYFVEEELRITANLHYGFFRPERDLGCYVLGRQELRLTKGTYHDRAAVELQAGELTFCLGQRAGAFLESAGHEALKS